MLLSAGCAATKAFGPPEDDVHAQRVKRDAETTRRFSSHRDMAEFEAAMDRWNQQDVKGCRDQLDRLLARNPDHRDARLLMADVLVARRQPHEALSQVRQALKAHPTDPDVQYAMGLMLDANGQGGEALSYYERAAKAEPSNEAYAMSYRTAREAAARPPAAPPPPAGVTAVEPPADPKAPAEISPAASMRPMAATRCSAVDSAINPQAAADLEKGCKSLAAGSTEAASSHFRAAVARDPYNPQILIDAATAALRYNQPRLAVELLSPASRQPAASAVVHRMLGVAYYRLGDYASSQSSLRQALSLDKSSALSYFLMGCTLTKLGQPDGAEAHFHQAQALDPRYSVQR
jgi:Tfp pilus assembly protein PilF